MTKATRGSKLQAVLLLLSALRSRDPAQERVLRERSTRPLVKVTSDFGVAPIFPGLR